MRIKEAVEKLLKENTPNLEGSAGYDRGYAEGYHDTRKMAFPCLSHTITFSYPPRINETALIWIDLVGQLSSVCI